MYWDTFDLNVMEDEQTPDGHIFIERILLFWLKSEHMPLLMLHYIGEKLIS